MSTQDYFASRFVGKQVQIKANGKTISKTGNNPQTCYTQKLIASQNSMIYKWYFKINRRDHELVIGIASNHKTTDSAFHRNMKDINYGYSVENGQKVSKNKYSDYGCKCNKNDKIEMILDLRKKQLSFIVNNIDQGVIYDDIEQHKNIRYRVAIFIQTNGTSVTLQKYEEMKVDGRTQYEYEEKAGKIPVMHTNTNNKNNKNSKNNKNDNNITIHKILKQLEGQKTVQQKMDKRLKNIMEAIKDIKSTLDQKQNYVASNLVNCPHTTDTTAPSKCSIICYIIFVLMLIMFIATYSYGQYFGIKQDL